ncbi:FAD-dependent oxidoreductase [Aurantiacibacter gilvus]|uniref:FAD-dependent oxidoreductase n=1 Tax=Aurantiacibacter gilvus TaxID=3139141 RepID=A0ABU9IFS6_9SPHN
MSKKVCVIGGGVAGLAVAIGLHQQGIDVEVVERDKDWKVYHVGIIVQANFIRALEQLGLGKAAVNAGYPYRGARFMTPAGEVLAELPGESQVDGLPGDLGLTRPALHEVLTGKVKELGIPVKLGVTFESFEDRGDAVDVEFTDGSSGTYDLLIAADGNYSAVRKVLWPDAKPAFTGQGVWRYNVPRPADLEWSDLYIGVQNGYKGKAGYCPLTPEEMYIFVVTEEPGNPRFDPATLADEMSKRLAGYGGMLGEAAKAVIDPALVVYRPLEACIMPDPWYQGRVVLIGDAAHSATPHLGQGAAMAVEDAVVLAEELGEDQPIDAALRAFMDRRFERAKLVGTSSIMLGEWEMHPGTAGDPVEVTERIRRTLAEPV